jgi:hypothetical protein
MYGPFHRLTDSADEVRKVLDSGELWGMAQRNFFQSDIPKSKAYAGKLPSGANGFEFETEVPPDEGHVPDKPTWAAEPKRHGVESDGVHAKIKVKVLRHTFIL